MASLFFPSLTLGLSLWILLILPAHSLTCTSQSFNNNKLYKNCSDLSTLNSYLHYTYNASNSSLSIAFISTPASSNGWIAWAINPTGTGMVGSQALIALKSNGVFVAETYNISSYSSILRSKLSFDVWDLRAESSTNGTVIIYGSVKVPDKVEKLNQVWQVGASVTDGHPVKHEMATANLNSKGTLFLVGNPESLTPASAPSPSATSGGGGSSTPENGGLAMVRTNNLGLFLGLVLFLGSVFAL